MKDKAKELVDRFYTVMPVADAKINSQESDDWTKEMEELTAKQCALICVDEIINVMIREYIEINDAKPTIEYWQGVKQEIEKL